MSITDDSLIIEFLQIIKLAVGIVTFEYISPSKLNVRKVWCFLARGMAALAIKCVKVSRGQKSWGQSESKQTRRSHNPPVGTRDSGLPTLTLWWPISFGDGAGKSVQNWPCFVCDPFLWNVWLTRWVEAIIQSLKKKKNRKAGLVSCLIQDSKIS